MKDPFISKKAFKRKAGKCRICGENNYNLLDVHRWGIEGKDGGKYASNNCVCVCSNCHRLIHAKKIQILGIYNSTIGELLHFINEKGKEDFT